MTRVLLIYPYFKPRGDRSVFRFPPLGISYVAASLRDAGHDVRLLDCTFMKRGEALEAAQAAGAEVAGIYCMAGMLPEALWFAGGLRATCRLLVAGGPLPTCDPGAFVAHFDVVVRGEGEQSMVELLRAWEGDGNLAAVPGIAFRSARAEPAAGDAGFTLTADRPITRELDAIARPARELLPNSAYIRYGKAKYGYAITTVMTTRGCPYRCEFCSNVIHGGSYRERSPGNVVDEIEEALALGYDRISFADDVFTLNGRRVRAICREIERRGLTFRWECLGRVDALDDSLAREMRQAGCERIFFGVESGDDAMLELMNKGITVRQVRDALGAAHRAGLQVGAFFILFYPGDSDDTVIETLRFARSLPLDYVGLSKPYLLPGTALLERVTGRPGGAQENVILSGPAPSLPESGQDSEESRDALRAGSHEAGRTDSSLEADREGSWPKDPLRVTAPGRPAPGIAGRPGGASRAKVAFAILKGHAEFRLKRRLRRWPALLELFARSTDKVLRWMR